MALICTTASSTTRLTGMTTEASAERHGERNGKPLAETLLKPVEQRVEQVCGDGGHHDENEVAAQEVGTEGEGRWTVAKASARFCGAVNSFSWPRSSILSGMSGRQLLLLPSSPQAPTTVHRILIA